MKKRSHPQARSAAAHRSARSVLALAGLLSSTALIATAPTAMASSHSDAPLIKLDPQANLTDVYAFIRNRPSGEKVLVVSVAVRPFSEPGDGGMYDAFSPDAIYSIHITNPTTGVETQRYDFRFSDVTANGGGYKNKNTILRYGRGTEIGPIETVGDARQNFVQSYVVTKKVGNASTILNGPLKLLVPPPNVGINTTPDYNGEDGAAISGAAVRADLDPYTFQTTYDLPGGTTVFAGPREDGFYADTPAIFDLLNNRIQDNNGNPADGFGQDGNGVDGFKGYNVLTYSIVIPVSALQSSAYTGALQTPSSGVGVYASVSRPQFTLRSTAGPDIGTGAAIQVNRLGNPLFNEVLVAIADKDNYNRSSPKTDATLFAKYASTPEIAVLINAVYGTSIQTTNRADLVAVFIPDVLRVNTTTGPVPVAGEEGFNRLSFIGGDTVNNGGGNATPAGWPNGRRFGDDVVDIALTAVANGPAFAMPLTLIGDNVSSNDQTYNMTFPYAATPHAGPANSKDSSVNVGF